MTTDPQVLRAEQFEEVGSLLQAGAATILERWCQRAVIEEPAAERVHHSVLRDELARLLDDLGRSLASSYRREASPHRAVAREHGRQRWESGWSISEVIRDYQILRLIVLEYIDEILDRPLGSRETMAVGLAIDEAISASVVAYVRFRDEAQQESERETLAQYQRLNEAILQGAVRLQAARRRTNEFLGTLAHELRNPLAPIMYAIEASRLTDPTGTASPETLAVIQRQAWQIARLVDDLLDVTRISQGKLSLRRERTDLGDIFAQARQSTAALFAARDQTLICNPPEQPLMLSADPARLVQVVTNLLNNAGKYSPPGSRVWLSGQLDGEQVVVRVRDEGVGISPELLPQVFDMFQQIDRTIDQSQGGLGIGLALVKSLVELHHGSVSAHSEGVGHGSEFVVRLPCGSAPEVGQPSPAPSVARPRRILLIEDDADNRDLLAELLRRQGHTVSVASTAEHGLTALGIERPELALVDIGLPDLDGYLLARAIRALPEGDRLLLVAITGYGQPEERRLALESGFDAHLVKPVKLEDLARLVAQVR